jgi:hypothetical protein
MPKVLHTSLTDLRVLGHSLILVIFEGLMVICPFPRCTPRKSISVHLNSHFDGFRKYECSLNMSRSWWFMQQWRASSSSAVVTRQSFM